jgi:hypothetical protein
VGGKKKKEYKGVAEVVHGRINGKKADEIKAIVFDNGPRSAFAKSPYLNKTLTDFKVATSSFQKMDFKANFAYVNDDLFIKGIALPFDLPDFSDRFKTPGATSSDGGSATVTSQAAHVLKLMLKKVKCLDETDPEWWGKDEIAVGGVAVDDKQVETKITPFSAGSFNDGDSKSYNPDKVLKSFTLDATNPSTFFAFLTLAEKDGGGFADFIQELYEAIKAETQLILTALGAAAGAAIGAAIGGSIGTTIAGPLGTVIGIAAGVILGALVGWIVELLKDDIFDPQITAITINRNEPFTGPVQKLTYRDFGGSYYIQVYWTAS